MLFFQGFFFFKKRRIVGKAALLSTVHPLFVFKFKGVGKN